MDGSPSRLATSSRLAARAMLGALLLLMVRGLLDLTAPVAPPRHPPGAGDAALYRAIARDTGATGAYPESYYDAAFAEQRARGYPLRPFVTVREPALALLSARLGERGTILAYQALALLAAVLLALRLRTGAGPERVSAPVLAATSILLLAQPALAVWHEAWAGLLVVLAIALRRDARWWPACLAGLAAMLVRELAAPMIAALALAAATDGRRREAAGWAAALIVFALALTMHAGAVAAHLLPGDRASPGWSGLYGWRFVLESLRMTSLFALVPPAVAALLVPLALLGWASRGGGTAARATMAIAAFAVPAMIVARPDNLYWGLMIAPLLPAGLAYAPRALADLLRAARQPRAPSPHIPAWDRASS